MKKTYSLSENSKMGSFNSSLIVRQHKLDLMARFMEIKASNARFTQNEFALELGYSSTSVKRYRNDVNMPSPYRVQ